MCVYVVCAHGKWLWHFGILLSDVNMCDYEAKLMGVCGALDICLCAECIRHYHEFGSRSVWQSNVTLSVENKGLG